jgi:Glycosyltransferase 61
MEPLSEDELFAEAHRETLAPYYDAAFYRESNPDIPLDCDPYRHFMLIGWKEGRNPSATFDVTYYNETYKDVSKNVLNPLYHFALHGAREGRAPSAAVWAEQHRQTLAPYFDADYYRQSNPDLPADCDPYQHFMLTGWKEGRNPSAAFDVSFYLRVYPDIADVSINPLYHYVLCGKDEGRKPSGAASARRSPMRRLIRQAVNGLPLFAVFVVLCLGHAFRRQRVEDITASEHAMHRERFLRIAVTRYWRRRERVRFLQPVYLTQVEREAWRRAPFPFLAGLSGFSPPRHSHRHDYQRFMQSPRGCARLYLANVLKHEGFFQDAEFLYRSLGDDPAVCTLALAALGDLLLLQAGWAREVAEHEFDGTVVNILRVSAREGGARTWRKRQFSEAIDTLSEAVTAEPGNRDAWRLLGCAYLEIKMWKEALASIHRHVSGVSATAYDQACEGRALFGIDRAAGTAALSSALRGPSIWQMTDAEIVASPSLTSVEGVWHREIGEPTTLHVKSQVVRDGKILCVQNTISFEGTYLAKYERAEVLPNFGMLLVNEKYLIAESLHYKGHHWPLFTPSITAVAGSRAMICRQTRQHDDSYYDHIFIGYNRNYYHWLIDELPRLLSVEKFSELSDRPILVDSQVDVWQVELLDRLGIERSRLRKVEFRQACRFGRLIVPSRLSTKMVAHPDAVRFMRDRLAPHAAAMSPQPGKRLYLTRGSDSVRKSSFINERSVIDKFKKANFSFVDPGKLTIGAQIDLFADAEVIAGPGGAGMANALFAPAKAKILELSSASMLCETFGSITSSLGQEHWWCAGISYPRSFPAWVWTTFDYEISERDIDLCFERLL